MKPGRLVQGMALWTGMVLMAGASGCGRPTPPPAPTPIAPEPEEPSPKEVSEPQPEPQDVEPEPVAPTVAAPTIPDAPVSGVLDGEPFALAKAEMRDAVLTLTDADGRTIAVVVFHRAGESVGLIDLTSGEIPFGSPHVVVRAGADQAAMDYTESYRLRLELDGGRGGIWLELPEGRGIVAGTIDLRPKEHAEP